MTSTTTGTETGSTISREDRTAKISQEIAELLSDLSGLDLAAEQYGASFLELGFDSLFLTQAAQKIQNKYGVKVAFRQLLDTLGSIRLVAEYLEQQLPQDAAPVVSVTQVEKTAEPVPTVAAANLVVPKPRATAIPPTAQASMVVDGNIATLMQQQLQAVTQLIKITITNCWEMRLQVRGRWRRSRRHHIRYRKRLSQFCGRRRLRRRSRLIPSRPGIILYCRSQSALHITP